MPTYKNLLLPSVAVFLLFAASVLSAAPTVLDFEAALPSSEPLTGTGVLTEYGGVQWGGEWEYYDADQGEWYAPSSPKQRVHPLTGGNYFCFSFDTPRVFTSAAFNGRPNTRISLNLYDENGTWVAWTDEITIDGWTPVVVASGCDIAVKTVEVYSSGGPAFIMDDVTFEGDVPTVLTVPIDIDPSDSNNTIDLKKGGTVSVAILSTATFDATTVDPGSVVFGEAAPSRSRVTDVNRDTRKDLLLEFAIRDLTLPAGPGDATLTGTTYDGMAIQGTDTVNVIPAPQHGKKK
jgi:hypothetical protein